MAARMQHRACDWDSGALIPGPSPASGRRGRVWGIHHPQSDRVPSLPTLVPISSWWEACPDQLGRGGERRSGGWALWIWPLGPVPVGSASPFLRWGKASRHGC